MGFSFCQATTMAVIQSALIFLYSILILHVHCLYLKSGNQFQIFRVKNRSPQIKYFSATLIIGTNSGSSHPSEALCEGALEMFALDESTRAQEKAINIGQNENGRRPYGYRKIMPFKDFSSHSLFVKVNGNCCWKLFTRYRYRGNAEVLQLGEERDFSFFPKSLKLIECPNN